MHMLRFPGCCTASILTGFGQSDTADTSYRPANPDDDDALGYIPYKAFRKWVEAKQEQARQRGDAILFATTNNDQVIAEQVFTDLGWISTKPVTKTAHADKTLRGWMKPLDDIAIVERTADDLDINF